MSRGPSGGVLTGRALERHFARRLADAVGGQPADLDEAGFERFWVALDSRARDRDDVKLRRLADRLLDHFENLTAPLGGRREAAFELLVTVCRIPAGTDPNLWRLEIERPYPNHLELLACELSLSSAGPDTSLGPVFSIDAATTLDRDDAFSYRLDADGIELAVHVVHPFDAWSLDSEIDLEARRRSASIYLPDGDAPMLPSHLSENLWSLLPGERRPVLTVTGRFTQDGSLIESSVVLGTVRVDSALDYASAAERISEQADWRRLAEWASKRRERRRQAGAAWAELPRARVDAANGEMRLVRSERDGLAHQLVAELNVWFNETIAHFAAQEGIDVPYRTQPPPEDTDSMREWEKFADPIVAGVRMIEFMRGAKTHFLPDTHAGLGVTHYVQASSPLRRYEDSLVHRQVGAYLRHGEQALEMTKVRELCADVDEAGRLARKAMRRSQDTWRLRYIASSGSKERNVVVTHPADAGQRARVVDIETMMRVRMKVDRPVEVGERVRPRIRRIDPRGGRFELELVTVSQLSSP